MSPVVKDLVLLLDRQPEPALGIPTTVRMDRLMESGDSISVAMKRRAQDQKRSTSTEGPR